MNDEAKVTEQALAQTSLVKLPEQTRSLVTIQPDDGSELLARWMSDTPTRVTNLAADDPLAEILVAKAMGVADRRTRACVGQPLRLTGYVVHPVELVNKETGEITVKLRCVLLTEDGGTISSMSGGVLRVLREVARSRGPKRWHPPVDAEIREYPLEAGASYCMLVLTSPPSAKATKGAK